MTTTDALCITCAPLNMYDHIITLFAPAAFSYIADGITLLLVTFMMALGILKFSVMMAIPGKSPKVGDILLTAGRMLMVAGFLSNAGPFIWRTYIAINDWAFGAALGLMEITAKLSPLADQQTIIPTLAVSPAARMVGAAENIIWSYVTFSWSMIKMPGLSNIISGTLNDLGIVIFAIWVTIVYGGLIIYIMFLVLRAVINMALVVVFSSLTISAFASRTTMPVFKAGTLTFLNGALSIVGVGVSLGFTNAVLGVSRTAVKCLISIDGAASCVGQLAPLAKSIGVTSDQIENLVNSYEIFVVLIIIGASVWIFFWLTNRYIARLTSTDDDSSPMAAFAGATTAIIANATKRAASTTKRAAASPIKLMQTSRNTSKPAVAPHSLDMD